MILTDNYVTSQLSVLIMWGESEQLFKNLDNFTWSMRWITVEWGAYNFFCWSHSRAALCGNGAQKSWSNLQWRDSSQGVTVSNEDVSKEIQSPMKIQSPRRDSLQWRYIHQMKIQSPIKIANDTVSFHHTVSVCLIYWDVLLGAWIAICITWIIFVNYTQALDF